MNLPEGVAVLSLDRPEKGNALSPELVAALHDQVCTAIASPAVHTIAFVAQGRNFCTGFDLSSLEGTDNATLLHRFVQVELLLDAVWRSPVRTVALAQGRAWGAGADLFAACDARLASPDASFRFPGAAFGLVLGTRRLSVRVGQDEARNLTCNGGELDAPGALRCGLATRIVADFNELAALCVAPVADRATVAALRLASGGDVATSDRDLAALVRSATRPGLKERISAYRNRTHQPPTPH